jgi:REP element-mobilizing transposase RayT
MILNKKTMDKNKYNRCSIRLKNYDYSSPGTYFITICTYNRQCLFGEIVNGEMRLNEYGEIVRDEWYCSVHIRNEIELFENEFIVMPNHIHGIVRIVENRTTNNVGATGRSPLQQQQFGQPHGPLKKSLSSFVAGFKSSVTKQINQIRQTPGIPVWQRNYYEHIIRNDNELNKIREYIINNPKRWKEDNLNKFL